MRTITCLPTMLITALLLFGCKKENDLQIQQGTYKGTFTVTYESGTHTGQTTVELKDERYTCLANANRIPAGGSGKYFFDKKSITFNDENFWTAEFDGGLILNGNYDYTFDGRNLKINRMNEIVTYTYDLKIQ
ncbi:hypothetical protein [Sphingobacterium yanglingense]|uniref:Lipocalin-like protein n=1 Tax=Sphingobacterium yanglingense TaxID=1437280 RepID=A0A4R6W8S9_9SPHI|nr:hypothetical protein [Sphingobacterium yanglingense]TDQ73469.1 hypothetical protein CLV99_4522 [Sphingobacterium yanglingense]